MNRIIQLIKQRRAFNRARREVDKNIINAIIIILLNLKKMKNWKTTVSGIIAAAGLSMQASDNATVKIIGLVLAALGSIMIGGSAKDNNVTGGTKQQ